MRTMFHEKSIAAARKEHNCSWCGELIEVGQPYNSYRLEEMTVKMHPECYTALGEAADEEGGWIEFCPGDFSRGCTCESGHCRCPRPLQDVLYDFSVAQEVPDAKLLKEFVELYPSYAEDLTELAYDLIPDY